MSDHAQNLKQADITNCARCGDGLMKDHQLLAYRVKIDTLVFDLNAIGRQHGMEMMMGAAAPLAQHMGPNEDMAIAVTSHEQLVCMTCVMEGLTVAEMLEGDET